MEEAGGVAFPDELLQIAVDAGDDPDIAAPGGEAARPSEKKSKPPKRIHDLYGFLKGGVSESMV